MASACSILYEEQLLCSICLGAFNEPVSTPCGHNFCKGCITQYWNSQINGPAQCPLCKEKLGNEPKLRVNTEFRDVVEHFNRIREKDGPKNIAQPGEVPCDVCNEPKLKAHKTCLVCLASYCEPHLESHQKLKKHKLIDPVSNLEDRVCKKHGKMLELFCRTDQQCVCTMCLNDDHAAHEAVTLERAFKDRRVTLENVASEMKKKENAKSARVEKMKCSGEQSRRFAVDGIREIVQILTALVASVQKGQGELVEAIEQKQKEAEKEAADQITLLEQDLSDLRRRRRDTEELLQSEDYLYLLQNCPSTLTPENLTEPLPDSTFPLTRDLPEAGQHLYLEMVKKSVAQIEETLSGEMEMLVQKVRSSDCCAAPEQSQAADMTNNYFVPELWSPIQDELMKIQQCDAVSVTLDPYTANHRLTVSADGKRLTCGRSQQAFPSLFARPFKCQPLVLAKEGYSSGKFYYEVRVSSSKSWLLGVVKESINRDIINPPDIEDGAWTFCIPNNIFLNQIQTVGVFVDYEEGEVSFYDVEARFRMLHITGGTFMETTTALRSFLYSMAGVSTIHRPKVYPVFGIYGCNYGDNLVITPVSTA
ncbi:E3 ubiquitin-protein ligase TRIM7-like [Fundulus heteroclitus]|uniref:E3 ubiquitin-protein ligase TRIM7-like n=1 Tax=Fundulus heteroclitus TaxID=8078 RepID=UPI00165AC5AB|nr:E3 ubiquitin-protein ligase TRIM7-like [Fundulus heteroclitus]